MMVHEDKEEDVQKLEAEEKSVIQDQHSVGGFTQEKCSIIGQHESDMDNDDCHPEKEVEREERIER